MKNHFYYLRDMERKPRITVCISFDEQGNAYRGISICADQDKPEKNMGRKLAMSRMLKAFYSKESGSFIISERANEILTDVIWEMEPEAREIMAPNNGNSFAYKSQYNPRLTPYENKLKNKIGGRNGN